MFKKIIRYLRLRIVVPKGDYCYKLKKIKYDKERSLPFMQIKTCPYWTFDKRYLDEGVGYCKYLKVGDKDENSQGLLWDQVKECGINEQHTNY